MEPITRSEQYLASIIGEDVVLPVPQSRIEHYLNLIAQNGISPSSAGLISYDPDADYPDGSLGAGMKAEAAEVDDLKSQISGGGLTPAIKVALLQLAEKVAYIDDQGQDYYQDLYDALYPGVTYTITNTLTGCANSNAASVISDSNSYSATISASAGYSLTGATVSITMGGTDITASAYNNGTISIASVTGNIVITISAVAVTLSSISAVFTQGQTVVYDTDSLDSLKSMLVVTATYSDSSTQTVPSADYTLSGTLTVGTSTITVTYGGKTDTFTVTVTADTNLFDPATSPDENVYIRTQNNTITAGSTDTYHTTYVPIETNKSYKITKIVSSSFRIGLTADEPVIGTSVLYTAANHSGTEITVAVTQPTAAYLVVVYASNVTDAVNEQIRASLIIEEI